MMFSKKPLLLLLAPTLISGEVIRIPLNIRERSPGELQARMATRSRLIQALAAGEPPVLPVHDFKDTLYTSTIMVGNPGQMEEVIFDTGSSNLWVPNKQPAAAASDKNAVKKHVYNHAASSTYKANGKPFNIAYGSGPVAGYLSQDDISFNGLVLKDYVFAEVDDMTGLGKTFTETPMDGILGMAFSGIVQDGCVPPMQALVDSGSLQAPIFAFYLTEGSGSEMVLGGVDEKHYSGDFTFIPLSAETYWQVHLNAIKVGGQQIDKIFKTQNAFIDSGTSFLNGPDAESIAKSMGAAFDPKIGLFALPCDKVATAPNLTFTLGGGWIEKGTDFTLEAKDLLVSEFSSGESCGLSVFPSASAFILGDTFMRKFYVQFDWAQKRVGIAPSKAQNRVGIADTVIV